MKRVEIKNFCTAFIALVVEIVKEACFCLWGMIWVWIDEIKKALDAMSGLDLAKIVTKAMFYSLCVVGWIVLFFGIIFIGWAII
jgi:hypothetical protein